MISSRRSFLFGVGTSLIAAPAIVRAASLMPVKALPLELYGRGPALDALPFMQNLCTLAIEPMLFTTDFATILSQKIEQHRRKLLFA